MELTNIANEIKRYNENIVIIYAFNSTGKTRLSVEYKNNARNNKGKQTGIYYNAYSEDLFVWDNDIKNNDKNIQLDINYSSLNILHNSLNEEHIKNELEAYNFKFDFRFNVDKNSEKGIKSIVFFLPDNEDVNIKISRGEERIFVWCFFLALFRTSSLSDKDKYFFIDDPVSSLDDHNLFITAIKIMNLIESEYKKRKIIITTHHLGVYSTLSNWLTKGNKEAKFKDKFKVLFLNKNENDELTIQNNKKSVFLYHLHLLQKLKNVCNNDKLRSYHFTLLRQVLENVASFLGSGSFGYVLQEIGIKDNDTANIINVLSHKNVFSYDDSTMLDDNKKIFTDILDKLLNKYKFIIHINDK